MPNILTTSAILPSSLSVPISSRLFHFLNVSDPRPTDDSMIAADLTAAASPRRSDRAAEKTKCALTQQPHLFGLPVVEHPTDS